MRHLLEKTEDITTVHFYRTTGQILSGFMRKAEKAGFVVVVTFMHDRLMLALRYLKTTILFGDLLQRIPHGKCTAVRSLYHSKNLQK